MLERDVQVLDDLGLGRNDLHQLVRDLVGVQVVQTHPMEIHFAQAAQQLGQQALMPGQVHAVFGDVLRNDDQLLHPSVGQRLRFREQSPQRWEQPSAILN